MKTEQQMWQNLKGQVFSHTIEDLVQAAVMREKALGHELKVCIGSDSQVYRDTVYFATAVIIVRKGKGAFAYICKDKTKQKMSLKERMLQEVHRSVAVAYALCPILDQWAVEMEVHADINTDPGFKSSIALKEAMGYILGMGFQFVAKPNAFASSSCADLVV